MQYAFESSACSQPQRQGALNLPEPQRDRNQEKRLILFPHRYSERSERLTWTRGGIRGGAKLQARKQIEKIEPFHQDHSHAIVYEGTCSLQNSF